MLSINTIARVAVNTVRASKAPAAFDTGLLLVPDASFTEERRLTACSSGPAAAAGLTGLGFTADSEAYKAAIKKIDTAVTKNIIHKNTAARKKSRYTKMLAAM